MMKELSVALLVSMLLIPVSMLQNQQITVLNPQETPTIDSEWTVFFDTKGVGILEIDNLNPGEVVFSDLYYKNGDIWIRAESLSDGDNIKSFWQHSHGKIVFKVVQKGFHTLKFTFGNEDFAYNSAGQAVQQNHILNVSNPTILYEQRSMNTSNNFRFTQQGTINSGISLPKNSSIIYAFLNITGRITYTQSPSPGTVYDLKIYDVVSQTGNETVLALGTPVNNFFRLLNNSYDTNWSYPGGGLGEAATSVDIGDINTYVAGIETIGGSLDNNAYLLNESGDIIWTFTTDNDVRDVAVGELNSTYDGLEIALGIGDGNVTVLNATGHYIWSVDPTGEIRTVDIGNVNDSTGNEVIFGDASGNIHVYNATGDPVWTQTIVGATIRSIHVMNISDDDYDEIIIGDSLGYVRSLNATRIFNWNTSIGGQVFAVAAGEIDSSSPGLEVAAGTDGGDIISLNATGSYLWDYSPGSAINTIDIGNLTVDAGQEVAVGTGTGGTGDIYVFNFDNFPTDSFIDIGDDISSGDYDWNYDGKFRVNSNIDNATLWPEIISYMSACSGWLCNVTMAANSTYPGEFNFDLNITYEYDLSDTFNIQLQDSWSRTNDVYINESVGNRTYNVSFDILPAEWVEVRYIVANSSATECDFNNTRANMVTIGSVGVCNITPFTVNLTSQQMPDSFTFWDNNMSTGMPIILNMSDKYYSAPYRYKDFTIWNDTTTYAAPSEIFRNITSNITFVDEGFANPITFTVDWFNNGTYFNITPSTVDVWCNETNATYELINLSAASEFWVCAQDLDSNGVIDYIRWKQPQSFFGDNSATDYMLNGTGNTPPILRLNDVLPGEDVWGTSFNFTIEVNDSEVDAVDVTLWIYTPINGWMKNETKMISSGSSTNATLWWNLTSSNTWTNNTGDNMYKFSYKDPYITGYNTTVFYGPSIIKHNVSIEYVFGNDTEVNRTGSDTTYLGMRVYDQELSQYVGANVNFTVNVSIWNTYPFMSQDVTNSTGFANISFDPNGTYGIGDRTWVGGVYDDWYYSDNVTDIYGLLLKIIGDFNVVYTLSPVENSIVDRYDFSNYHDSNVTWDITSVTEDNGTAITGYGTWIYWNESLVNDTGQTYGILDIPNGNVVGNYSNFTLLIKADNFNNFTELSNYTVHGLLVFNLTGPANLTQMHRTYDVINLSVNVSDEIGNYITDAGINWWLQDAVCDQTYNMSNGTYLCDFNASNTITPGEYNWTIDTYRQYYDGTNDTERSWLHVNGSLNISFQALSLTRTYPRGQTTNITAFLRDENEAFISIPYYNCTWYKENTYVGNSTTNSTGICALNWTSGCSDQLGEYLFNITLAGNGSDYYTLEGDMNSTTLNLTDSLTVLMEYPINWSIIHRTEVAWLNATVFDSCGYPDAAFNLTWYNETLNITAGMEVNETWTVPTNYTLGSEWINATAAGGNYTSASNSSLFYIYGWSEPVWVSPTGQATYGINSTLTCLVRDSNTTDAIPGYNTTFWDNQTNPINDNPLGWNMTNSTGHAHKEWEPPLWSTMYLAWCNLSDNQTLYYNSSGKRAEFAIYVADNGDPGINETSISNNTIEASYQYTRVTANVTDDIAISDVWIQAENLTGTANYSMTYQYGSPDTGEIWLIDYNPPVGGIYNITVWTNDTSDHKVMSFAGNFTAIGYTTADLLLTDPSDWYYELNYLTEANYNLYTRSINFMINNTGNATIYNPSLTPSAPISPGSSIFFSPNPYLSCGNITPNNSCSGTIFTTVYTIANLGNNSLNFTLSWDQANKTSSYLMNSSWVFVGNNTYLEITDGIVPIPGYEIKGYVVNGTSRIVGNITIEAWGTTELKDVNLTFSSGTFDTSWINFTPFWNISLVPRNLQNETNINVTVPSAATTGNYYRYFVVNATNSTCNTPSDCWKTVEINLTVYGADWEVSAQNLTKVVGLNTFGTIDFVDVYNKGNVPLNFNVSISGSSNVTANVTSFNISSFENELMKISWNTTGAEVGTYYTNVTINNTDPGRYPDYLNISVLLNVTNLGMNIEYPRFDNAITDVVYGQILPLQVDAFIGAEKIGSGINWTVLVGGQDCPVVAEEFNQTGDEWWHINCTLPTLSGNPIWNNLFVEGEVIAQSAFINDIENNAVIYRDITAPQFTPFEIASITPNNNVTFFINITDNQWLDTSAMYATLQYESDTPINITSNMTYLGNNRWVGELVNLASIGDYWINLTIRDNSTPTNLVNSSIGWFDVYNPIYFDGMVKDPLGNNVSAVFNFYVPAHKNPEGNRVLVHSFNTSNDPEFNQTLHKRIYDLKIISFNHTLEYFNLTTNIVSGNVSDYISLDDVSASAINVDPDITYYSIIGVYVGNLFTYDSAAIRINFSRAVPYITHQGLGDLYYSRFRIFRCANWNFSAVSCAGTWESAGGTVDENPTSPYYETIYLTTPSTSAFGLVQCLRDNCAGPPADPGGNPYTPPVYNPPSTGGTSSVCGNDVCETGENSENCPADCATAELLLGAETTLSEVYMKPGENRSYQLSVSNTQDESKQVSVSITGDILNFVTPSTNLIEIPGQSSRIIELMAYIPQETSPGTYTGYITLYSEGRTRNIPVTIIVTLEGAMLLDLALDVLTKQVIPGETMKFSLIIYDLGIVKTVPTNLTYNVKDVQTEGIIIQGSKELTVTSTLSIIESMNIPDNITLGRYFLEVLATYSNKTISINDEFEIVQPFWTIQRIQIAAVIIIIVIGTISAYYGRKRYLKWKFEKAKYVFPVSYRSLPKQMKNGIWLGKIAETNRKAWFYPELLTTHALVSGSTGSGKSVTASVIAEECLKQNIPVVVFDPTAQWTGFVRRCKDKNMMEAYPKFGMDPYDARPFKGMIFEVDDPNLYIDFKDFMNPGEMTVFNLNKLKPGEYDAAVWNIVDSIFAIKWEESTELKMLIIFDEVHRLLEKYGGRGGYVALEKAVREFRKWGIGLIMCSQVSSDFKEAIQGNILTEIQMSTKSLTDIRKVESKFGVDYAKRISREAVGVGMLQNPKFNQGKPYFVEFRPTLHSPHKLTEKELSIYRDFAARLGLIETTIDGKKKKGEDVFDISLELKLAGDKLKTGSFRMAEIYLESLEEKLGIKKRKGEESE